MPDLPPPNLKMDLRNIPPMSMPEISPKPGDVYTKAGGPAGFWWIIAVVPSMCIAIAFDIEGKPTGCQNYSKRYFNERDSRRIGFMAIPKLEPIWY